MLPLPTNQTPKCHHLGSMESRCSWPPLDCSLYNNFYYSGPVGFGSGRGGVTPRSVAGLQQVSSSILQSRVLFSPAALPAHCFLTPEQSAKVFHLGAECQAVGTQLAKQFQQLSGLEAMQHAVAQAIAHETINRGHVERSTAYIVLSASASDKKYERTVQKLCKG